VKEIVDKINILEQVFLRLAFGIILFVFGLLYLFHQVTFTVAMQEMLIAVFTQFGGNIALVQLESGVNEQPRVVNGEHRENQKPCR